MLSLERDARFSGLKNIVMDGVVVGWLHQVNRQQFPCYMAEMRTHRAGKHRCFYGSTEAGAMAEIVADLHQRCWSDAKIGRELGMDPDEVLRLRQVSGLAAMFADREFSEAWEIRENDA